jgi:hypothetical membrane protein
VSGHRRRPPSAGCGTLGGMRRWVIASSGVAPVALIGGWTWAAALQGPSYDSLRDTISALAARDATDRGVMTAGLAVLGLCHLATAAGLVEAGVAARTVLAVGGAATLAVAALPQPAAGHVPAATVGFVALSAWPALSQLPGRRAGYGASLVLAGLLGWLATQLRGGDLLGLSERALAGTQAIWPLIVAGLLLRRRRALRPQPIRPATS